MSNGWQFSGIAGKNYLPCLHVMSDELAQQTEVLGWQKGLGVQSTGIILGNTGYTRL